MNKHYLLLATYAIVMLLIAGCKKPDPPKPDDPEKLCRIQEISNIDSTRSGRRFAVDFEYDDINNNLKRIHQRSLNLLHDYLFRYDSLNRVSDIIVYYFHTNTVVGEYFSTWYRPMIYDAKNRIIKDSIYYGGTIGEGPIIVPEEGAYAHERAHTYDTKDRIIKTTETYESFGMTIINEERYFYNSTTNNLDSVIYSYDSNNQRHKVIYSKYDNKVNIRRTNPILQYVDRNYSRNNNFNTTAYNEYNLPTAATPYDSINGARFLSFSLNWPTIKYICNEPAKNALK